MAKRRSKQRKAANRRAPTITRIHGRVRINIDPFEIFTEWLSAADEKAYASL
jgi:hypothetical protein